MTIFAVEFTARRMALAIALIGLVGCAEMVPDAAPGDASAMGGAGGGLGGEGGQGGIAGGPGGVGGAGGAGGIGGEGGSGGAGGDPVDPLDCQIVPQAATARLLTRTEYDNTVRDVLGDATRPAQVLPAPNSVLGFDNNAEFHRATPAGVQGFLDLADDVATRAVAEGRVPACAEGPEACVAALLDGLGRRLFRRTLRAGEAQIFSDLYVQIANVDGAVAATRLVVSGLLQSPQFLYRIEEIGPDEVEGAATPLSGPGLAGRLAAFLWASTPDEALLDAAERGDLSTADGVRAQVQRMLADPRTRDSVHHFHRQWLHLDALDTLVKDRVEDFPGGAEGLRTAYARSMQAFIEDAFWQPDGVEALLSSPTVYLTPALAALLDIEAQGDDVMAVELPENRAGLLTQPALLAALAHPDQTSPIHRGIFVRERILCQTLPDPPPNLVIDPPDPDPNATTRERFAQHTEAPTCQGCHTLIDPIGFGFEGYDELGKRRRMENGRPIDDSGAVNDARAELDGPFVGAVELAERLSRSDEARKCMATQWFRYAMARGETREDRCAMRRLQARLVEQGSFLDLLVEMAASDALRMRPGVVIGDVPPLVFEDVEPEPDAAPPDAGRAPVGVLDEVLPEGIARGWSFDPDDARAPTLINLYLDGDADAGLFLGGFRADEPRADVNAAHPEAPGDHGFRILLPDTALDGRPHALTAVAVNSGAGGDTVLDNSPIDFRAGLNANPPAEPNPPADQHLPQGFLDGVSVVGRVNGWALDRDVVGRPIEVHFYLDGSPYGGGEHLGSTLTDSPRGDVNTAIGHPGDHGWHFELPPRVFDGAEHTLRAYAFNAGQPGNVMLSRSPFIFRLEAR